MFYRIATRFSAAAVAMAVQAVPRVAHAAVVARTPVVVGNGWVALSVIGLLVAVIYFLIRGTLHVEDRDARFYGGRRRDDGGFFLPGTNDDDDDIHHHHGGHGGHG